MNVVCISSLYLLSLIVTYSCLISTDCAESSRKRDKNVYQTQSTSRAKKSKNVEEMPSTSGTPKEAVVYNKKKYKWTKAVDDDILSTVYNNLRDGFVDWYKIFPDLKNRHADLPSFGTTQSHVYHLIHKVIFGTPTLGEENILWTKEMKSELIRIYYQTRGENATKHASKIYAKWRGEKQHFPKISPRHLLDQAENILMKIGILEVPRDLPKERMNWVTAEKSFKFNPEQEALIHRAIKKILLTGPMKIETLYDELCKKNPIFYQISAQKIHEKAKYMVADRPEKYQRLPDEDDEETDLLNQSVKEERHHFYEFLNMRSHHEVEPRSFHHFSGEVASSSSHPGTSHDPLNLNLSLGSTTMGTQRNPEPDVDLELSLSSQKKKGKSILKKE